MSDAAGDLQRRALQARREGRLADARRDLMEAVSLLREGEDRTALAQALRNLGELERRMDGEAARRHYEEAVAILRESVEPLRLAHTVRHLGDVYCEAGCAELAEPCYHEALALYRGHDHTLPIDLANAIRSLAVLKEDAGDIEGARRLWGEARDLYAAVDVAPGVAESAARLALLARRAGRQ
ncbi:MAG TPA: tetratricopeptide repeat protein [Thermoanaerobaculia bacterium]|nr:tetratricopeptide repeat protein [Thermoanaerobaculia bacterium]